MIRGTRILSISTLCIIWYGGNEELKGLERSVEPIFDFYRRCFLLGVGGWTDSERNFENIPKNNKPHNFTTPRPLGSYKIGNNDFITIWGSVNLKNMIPTTIYCSNPTENVLKGSIGRTESPWTLNTTPVTLTSGGDLILGSKNRFITIPDVFDGGSLHESGELRIKIHRIVTYIYEIRHFFHEVYSSCVTFVPDYQVIT